MAERPILFADPMVRAILDDRKTQTRRLLKPQPVVGRADWTRITPDDAGWLQNDNGTWRYDGIRDGKRFAFAGPYRCPYGHPGDRLWVRETFKPIASGEVKHGYGEVRYGYAYRADGATRWNDRTTKIHDLSGQPPTGPMQFQQRPWKPSIHMPHRASRITLEVTDVRVERLQDITYADAAKEGAEQAPDFRYGLSHPMAMNRRAGFAQLWEQINGEGSWGANPWVWVVEFRRMAPADVANG